ncbi:MAG: dienelactone hydrolase family protein [Acidimicrobiia bacterium]
MGALARGSRAATVGRVTLTGSDGAKVEAIHATPTDGVADAGIVLHPDIMGVRPLFDDLCERLATHGFAVCAPEPFARAPDEVRATDDPMVRMAHMPELDDALQLDDLTRAGDYLEEYDGVFDVLALGFCMGGMQILKAAATGEFERAVAFYGMIRVPQEWRGTRLREPLATAKDVCSTLAIFGGADPWTPAADIDALRRAWGSRPDCEIVVYPEADHGFVHAPERPTHRPDDAADAWQRTLAVLAS